MDDLYGRSYKFYRLEYARYSSAMNLLLIKKKINDLKIRGKAILFLLILY